LQSLANQGADQIPLEVKQEVSLLAQQAIRQAVSSGAQSIKQGQAGSLQYQVGACAFESYWETNYGGKREIHAKRSGLAPFVALKPTSEK
jgi:hypothetical protein